MKEIFISLPSVFSAHTIRRCLYLILNWKLKTVNYHYCCLLQVTELTPCETENPMGGWSLKLKFCFPQRFISSVLKRLCSNIIVRSISLLLILLIIIIVIIITGVSIKIGYRQFPATYHASYRCVAIQFIIIISKKYNF